MIDARSKRSLSDWFKNAAIHSISVLSGSGTLFPSLLGMWERMGGITLQQIAERFFSKLAKYRKISSECFLFDITHYYRHMASRNESKLARRGRNKEGKYWLRRSI